MVYILHTWNMMKQHDSIYFLSWFQNAQTLITHLTKYSIQSHIHQISAATCRQSFWRKCLLDVSCQSQSQTTVNIIWHNAHNLLKNGYISHLLLIIREIQQCQKWRICECSFSRQKCFFWIIKCTIQLSNFQQLGSTFNTVHSLVYRVTNSIINNNVADLT